jgi:hypothetical protein
MQSPIDNGDDREQQHCQRNGSRNSRSDQQKPQPSSKGVADSFEIFISGHWQFP